MNLMKDLAEILAPDRVSANPDLLAAAASDHSLTQPCRAACVAYPLNAEEVQALVRYANVNEVPLTPRSSAVGLHGASIPAQGGILVDLSRMNKILEIDPRNKKAKIEPGVTWEQAQTELAKQGLMVAGPLAPHKSRSVLASILEREPMVATKHEYTENLLTAEMVLPEGEMFWTGTATGRKMKGQSFVEALIPGTRLWQGAQGTLGILTWGNIKIEFIPTETQVKFLAGDELEPLIEAVYRIQYKMLGQECLILNNVDLAALLSASVPDIEVEKLPGWTVVLCLTGLHRRPEEKIAYENETLSEIAAELELEVKDTVGGITGLGETMLGLMRGPWQPETYWKFQATGARADVFFHTTMDWATEFIEVAESIADEFDYPAEEIGIYLQPLERARACFIQFGLPYDPADAETVAQMNELFLALSEAIVSLGGVFTTPFGPWAEMVYDRAAGYAKLMQTVKDIYDPKNILNPGKLTP
jgi:FAD/FMN-containing dehydrogenase